MQHEENSNPQTQIEGNVHTEGGAVNTGQIQTNGGDVIGRDKIIIQRLDPADQRNQRNHAALRQAVRRFWIEGVLKSSLHNEARIRLELEEQPDVVDNRPWDLVLQQTGQPDRPLAHESEIQEIFAELDRQLLILGEPGAGKTTTLLMLAEALLAQCDKDPTLPTPVVFNLSSWAETQPALEDWLVDELNTRYQMPAKVAQGWVEKHELLLLLDGLDEVATDKRAACVAAINKFRNRLVGMVVCSRTAEYALLKEQLKLQGAVAVRPLTSAQVEEYLAQAGAQVAELRTALAADGELQALAQTPLMLSVMTLAYQKQNGNSNAPTATGRTTRHRLFDRYIQRMFQHRGLPHLYAPTQTLHWLHWLAVHLTARSQTLFFIERLQPDWLSSRQQVNLFRLLVGLNGGLLVGLLVGLNGGLFVGLSIGLLFGLGFGRRSSIEAHESLNFSWRNGLLFGLLFGLSGGLGFALSIGLSVGLLSGLGLGLLGGLLGGLRELKSTQELQASWRNGLLVGLLVGLSGGLLVGLSGGLLVGLGAGLGSGLGSGLLFGLSAEMRTAEAEVRMQPNQGIWQSLRNGLLVGLIVGLIFGQLGAGLGGGLKGGLSAGLGGGLVFGLQSCLQHLILRVLLYRQAYIPWNYARFLDYAAERLFLHKVGGGYVFVHRMVLEHFAELSEEDMARIVAAVTRGSGK